MPRCLGIKVHLQHFSWWSSRSQAFLLERSQTESHFHEPLQLGEMGGPGPVAGAAAGSRPTYLKWSIDSLSAVAGARVCNANWNLTKLTSCWPTLWGNAAEHNHSGPCSCAPPDTRSATYLYDVLVDVLLDFCPDQVEREWRDLGQITTEKKEK